MKSGHTKLRGIERELRKDGVNEEQYSGWREANGAYESTTQQVAKVTKYAHECKAELETLESQLKTGYDSALTVAVDTSRITSVQNNEQSIAGQRTKSKVAYNLFVMNKDQELGSLNGSDDGMVLMTIWIATIKPHKLVRILNETIRMTLDVMKLIS